jgi:hypothetical protein
MNKSTLFKKAHKIAKATVAAVGNYMVAFKLALIKLHKENKMENKTKTICETLFSSKLYSEVLDNELKSVPSLGKAKQLIQELI